MTEFRAQSTGDLPAGALPHDGTFDRAEVDRFGRMAAEWWDVHGKFRPLHQLAPARLGFIRDQLQRHFSAPSTPPPPLLRPLAGLSVLDIGCGGGLVAEPLCRMGARVTGIDPASDTIETARAHAAPQGLAIDYRVARAEDLVAANETFDAVTCLEVLEHIPDPAAFLALAARLVRPGGLMIVSTINRTMKSYALAIVAAEYVLGWLPRGTHQWERFITPDEMRQHLTAAGLADAATEGVIYDPLRDCWNRSDSDTDVNYMMAAAKP